MDGVTIGILTIITILIVFRCVIVPISEVIRYNDYKKRHDEYVKQKDSAKAIPNFPNMSIWCSVVNEDNDLFSILDCSICAYKEECDEYIVRTGCRPDGRKIYDFNDKK